MTDGTTGGKVVAVPMGVVFSVLLGLLMLVVVNIALLLHAMQAAPAPDAAGRFQALGSLGMLDTETGTVWRREYHPVDNRGYWALETVERLHEPLPAPPAAVRQARASSRTRFSTEGTPSVWTETRPASDPDVPRRFPRERDPRPERDTRPEREPRAARDAAPSSGNDANPSGGDASGGGTPTAP